MKRYLSGDQAIISLTVFYVLFMLFLLPFFLSFFIKETPNDTQASLEGTQSIYKDTSVNQSFTSTLDNLSGIGTSIKNPWNRNKKDLVLNIYSDKGESLRTVNLNGTNILDGDFIVINFEPIRNSRNKNYSFKLSAPDSENAESLEIFQTSQKPDWIGELYVNNQKTDYKIPFVTYHKQQNVFSLTRQIFTQALYHLFDDLLFAVSYIIAIVTLVSYVIWLSIRKKDSNV